MKVFLDANVLLDVLMAREPFARESARVWALAETGRIEGLVSAVSFTTVYYVTRRTRSRDRAAEAMRILRDVFAVVPCDEGVLNRAIDAGLEDFEDAVQYFSAVAAGAEWIVTRDVAGFPGEGPGVVTPGGFWAVGGVGLEGPR